MQLLRTLFRFYIQSSIHVALAICAMAGVTIITNDLSWDWPVFGFIFSASITGYNFVKYAGHAKLHHRSLTNQLKSIQLFSLLCFLLLTYTLFLQTFQFIVVTTGLGIFTMLYAVPFAPHKKNLRRFRSLKIFVISLVWVGATLWLPLIDHRPLLTLDVALHSLSYFVIVIALTLPFEIRDIPFDDAELGTFPQRIGIASTQKTGYGLLLFFIILTIVIPSSSLSDIIINSQIAIVLGVSIKLSDRHQSHYYASFWVESIPILWFILYGLHTIL